MPKFTAIEPIEKSELEKMGFLWHQDKDGEYIVRESLITLSIEEALAYERAANELYRMYEKGAEYVIEKNLFCALDIPDSLVCGIKKSWRDERSNHLYGRFDLSGGIDGRAIKLIEFNADTPTLLLETALIQWMLLEKSQLKDAVQFNRVYEAISHKIGKISASHKGEFSRLLLSSVKGIDEERETVKLLQNMAKDAGVVTHFCYLEDIGIDEKQVLDEYENRYDFLFKLYPWEDMKDFPMQLETKILNPLYTLLYQSKGMLAILYRLFPDSPYLVPASFEPLASKYVRKRAFGREGANIDIVAESGELLRQTAGEYADYKSLYQEYIEFVQDEEGRYYQAGVFYSDGACGIGFRRGAEILDDMSQFVGHLVLPTS